MPKSNNFQKFLRLVLSGEQPTGMNVKFMTCQEFFSRGTPTCDESSVQKTGSAILYEKTTKCPWTTTGYGTGSNT